VVVLLIPQKISSKKKPDPGSEIRDLEKIHPGYGSRIQGVKKHRIRSTDSMTNFLTLTTKVA
jgi:hypothetical protein